MENNFDSGDSSDTADDSGDSRDSSLNIMSFSGSSLIESPIVKAVLTSGGLLHSSPPGSPSSPSSDVPDQMESHAEDGDEDSRPSAPPESAQFKLFGGEEAIPMKFESDSGAMDDDGEQQRCMWNSCQRRFAINSEALINHVNDEHVRVDKETIYTCRWQGCPRRGKAFNARYKMLIHIRTHTNEKPHRCRDCQKSFSRLENLKIHHRSHTGEKPYSCPVEGCNKAYSNSSDRFKHTRTHFDNKPYVCKRMGCDKRYTDPSSLRKHMKTYGHYREDRDLLLPNNTLRSPVTIIGSTAHRRRAATVDMSADELRQLQSTFVIDVNSFDDAAFLSAAAAAVFGKPFVTTSSSELDVAAVAGSCVDHRPPKPHSSRLGLPDSARRSRSEPDKSCRSFQVGPLDLSCSPQSGSKCPTSSAMITAGDGYPVKWGLPIGSN